MADGDETALSPPALPFGLDSGRQTELLSALSSEAQAREESPSHKISLLTRSSGPKRWLAHKVLSTRSPRRNVWVSLTCKDLSQPTVRVRCR